LRLHSNTEIQAVGGEVTAITVGGAGADKVLKDAKAIGVDHIVRIDCDAESLDSNALQTQCWHAAVSEASELM
jgi:electron transfer flavoprotein alpha/beta subunit